jgi:acetylornithine/succinyldiaminopimelate/putrescine aminotransferase
LLERAARLGERLGKGLASLVDGEHNLEARSMPGIWALRTAAHLDAPALHEALIDNGMIAWPIGPDTVAFCPPLVISDEQIDRCLDAADRTITALTAH